MVASNRRINGVGRGSGFGIAFAIRWPYPVRGWSRQAVLGSAGAYAEALLAAILVNLLALAIPLFAIVAFDQIVQFNSAAPLP